MRTLEWDSERCVLRLIDQRVLPGQFEILTCSTPGAVAYAIREMAVRGAPAIGVAAAFGMALAVCHPNSDRLEEVRDELSAASRMLVASRPTAVNLTWAVQRMMRTAEKPYHSLDALRQALVEEAQRMADEDVAINRQIAEHGAALLQDGDTVIHHCNTGALATVDWGTALGVIRLAHEQGKRVHVLVDETRPRLQGARLTAWELQQYGIPFEIITDGAAGYFLRSGKAQKVLFGADRVAMNGDVANKIGSYMLALAAHANNVPVYAVFPTSTIDRTLSNGDLIPIEERDASEVLEIQIHNQPAVPAGAKARNPAFDMTPHYLFTGLVTEAGVIFPPFYVGLSRIVKNTQEAEEG